MDMMLFNPGYKRLCRGCRPRAGRALLLLLALPAAVLRRHGAVKDRTRARAGSRLLLSLLPARM
jgi:hypothetical protein